MVINSAALPAKVSRPTIVVPQVLRRAFAGLHLSAILGWLDEHVKLRLSILLTYIFGAFPVVFWVRCRVFHHCAARSAARPNLC